MFDLTRDLLYYHNTFQRKLMSGTPFGHICTHGRHNFKTLHTFYMARDKKLKITE